MLYPEISESIIGASMAVLNELRPGLDEKLYENALVIELQQRGHQVEQQQQFPVFYSQQQVGTLIPDLIVDDKVIVDAKVVSDFNESHVAQMLGYLSITGYQLAILISFKEAKLKWTRVAKATHAIMFPRLARGCLFFKGEQALSRHRKEQLALNLSSVKFAAAWNSGFLSVLSA